MEFFDAYMIDTDDEVDGESEGEEDGEMAASPRGRRLQHSTYVNASIRKKLNYTGIGTEDNGKLKAIAQRRTSMHKKAFANLALDDEGYGVRLHDGQHSLHARFSPGSKGGTMALPFGGQIRIPPDTVSKGDIVTCRIVLPHDRYKYEPILRSKDDRLLSEIFLLTTNASGGFKRDVFIQLPRYQMNCESAVMRLLTKSLDLNSTWQDTEFMQTTKDSNLFCFETARVGAFAAVACPKTERFEIPVQGCLYMGKNCRQMSIRFPKMATNADLQCEVQLVPLNLDNISIHLRAEFLGITDVFKMVLPSVKDMEFKRSLTIKLPLPLAGIENLVHDDVGVMQISPEGWVLLDGPFKFNKNSVTFDTKTLTQFCVGIAKPGKKGRLCEAVTSLQETSNTRRGEVIPFFYSTGKTWLIWFDCIPREKVDVTMEKITKEGFQVIEQTSLLPRLDLAMMAKAGALPRRSKRKVNDLVIRNGTAFELEISGDISVSEDEPGKNNMQLLYHEKLSRNFRRFQVVPKFQPTEPDRRLVGVLKVYAPNPSLPDGRKCERIYDFDIEPEAVDAFFFVEPEPEVPEELAIEGLDDDLDLAQSVSASGSVNGGELGADLQKQKRDPQAALESFLRLTKPLRNALHVTRESKTLSGRSLKCLAKEIDKTVGLGIQLSLSESALTCMAFDALASGLTMSDMTYRVLLLWKRRSDPLFKGGQVDMLVAALRHLGRDDLADIVADRHRRNLELTPECFEECLTPPSSTGDSQDRPSSTAQVRRRASPLTSTSEWPASNTPRTTPVSDEQTALKGQNQTTMTSSQDGQTSPQRCLTANADHPTVIY